MAEVDVEPSPEAVRLCILVRADADDAPDGTTATVRQNTQNSIFWHGHRRSRLRRPWLQLSAAQFECDIGGSGSFEHAFRDLL